MIAMDMNKLGFKLREVLQTWQTWNETRGNWEKRTAVRPLHHAVVARKEGLHKLRSSRFLDLLRIRIDVFRFQGESQLSVSGASSGLEFRSRRSLASDKDRHCNAKSLLDEAHEASTESIADGLVTVVALPYF